MLSLLAVGQGKKYDRGGHILNSIDDGARRVGKMQEAVKWRSFIPGQITGPEEAITFVEGCGFCTWGPLPRLPFPNLAEAMGETATSVLDRTWFWKDDLHFSRQLYYGKIIQGQPSFIAPEYLPDFIAALAGRGQEQERDVNRLYFAGRLSGEAKMIYEYLDEYGAQPSRELRRGARLGEKSMKLATERALVELQRRFLICKVDLTGRTRGTYSYVWDLAERFCPEAFTDARQTSPTAARSNIRGQLREFGIEPTSQLENRLFLWT
ncbi:hypothetical protein [Ktedonobacter robiniae]|uniref:Uncharacterized protein n=1 Tax=Ktedonobacter robiniae TaxID=2778365 RepID=A0ABQ3UZD9_9CHLR|nr:hypothetical protein [Ktedonobacter robiniae]GHO58081.1 hypothetical protein KSB_65560 [Ktedonobacter robiniae]